MTWTPAQLKDLARRLIDLLKLKSLPVGLKMFENAAGLDAIAGLRRPPAGQAFSTCQLLTQARIAGLTLGIVSDNLLPNVTCGAVLGLSMLTEDRRSGQQEDRRLVRQPGIRRQCRFPPGAHSQLRRHGRLARKRRRRFHSPD